MGRGSPGGGRREDETMTDWAEFESSLRDLGLGPEWIRDRNAPSFAAKALAHAPEWLSDLLDEEEVLVARGMEPLGVYVHGDVAHGSGGGTRPAEGMEPGVHLFLDRIEAEANRANLPTMTLAWFVAWHELTHSWLASVRGGSFPWPDGLGALSLEEVICDLVAHAAMEAEEAPLLHLKSGSKTPTYRLRRWTTNGGMPAPYCWYPRVLALSRLCGLGRLVDLLFWCEGEIKTGAKEVEARDREPFRNDRDMRWWQRTELARIDWGSGMDLIVPRDRPGLPPLAADLAALVTGKLPLPASLRLLAGAKQRVLPSGPYRPNHPIHLWSR